MLNIGAGEIAVIAILALLILGPTRLPEFARGVGKFIREFRRQTDEVRTTVEREFYKMDNEVRVNLDVPTIVPIEGAAPRPRVLPGQPQPPIGPEESLPEGASHALPALHTANAPPGLLPPSAPATADLSPQPQPQDLPFRGAPPAKPEEPK